MINDNYVQQFLTTPASSCLINSDLINANVNNISVDLATILIRPGYKFLIEQLSLRDYLAWSGKIIINGSGLVFANSGKLQIKSSLDGTKHTFTITELDEFFNQVDADFILIPKNTKNKLGFNTKFYYANDEYNSGCGVYYAQDDTNLEDVQAFINNHHDDNKYLIGSYPRTFHPELAAHAKLMLENNKFCEDAYQGIVYRQHQDQSILLNSAEHDYTILADNCTCYTCREGYTVAYLHHLFKHTPLLCQRLLILHNVFYASHLPSIEMAI